MLRAATVVLDFFEAVPVTEMQSPAASELTASVTVLENWVVAVQLDGGLSGAGVLHLHGRATQRGDAPRCAGRLVGRGGAGRAAAVATATSAVTPPPTSCAQRRRFVRWLVGVCICIVPLSLSSCCDLRNRTVDFYSLRSASIGARDAARLAG